MAFMIKELIDLKGILILMLLAIQSQATNLDCQGKAFHCVNSTHFMICVDLGSGISTTIDDFIIPCPSTTVCKPTNRFECEFPVPTIIEANVNVAAITQTPDSEVTTFIPFITTSIPSEEYYNTISTTTLTEQSPNYSPLPAQTNAAVQDVTDTYKLDILITEESVSKDTLVTNADEKLISSVSFSDIETSTIETINTNINVTSYETATSNYVPELITSNELLETIITDAPILSNNNSVLEISTSIDIVNIATEVSVTNAAMFTTTRPLTNVPEYNTSTSNLLNQSATENNILNVSKANYVPTIESSPRRNNNTNFKNITLVITENDLQLENSTKSSIENRTRSLYENTNVGSEIIQNIATTSSQFINSSVTETSIVPNNENTNSENVTSTNFTTTETIQVNISINAKPTTQTIYISNQIDAGTTSDLPVTMNSLLTFHGKESNSELATNATNRTMPWESITTKPYFDNLITDVNKNYSNVQNNHSTTKSTKELTTVSVTDLYNETTIDILTNPIASTVIDFFTTESIIYSYKTTENGITPGKELLGTLNNTSDAMKSSLPNNNISQNIIDDFNRSSRNSTDSFESNKTLFNLDYGVLEAYESDNSTNSIDDNSTEKVIPINQHSSIVTIVELDTLVPKVMEITNTSSKDKAILLLSETTTASLPSNTFDILVNIPTIVTGTNFAKNNDNFIEDVLSIGPIDKLIQNSSDGRMNHSTEMIKPNGQNATTIIAVPINAKSPQLIEHHDAPSDRALILSKTNITVVNSTSLPSSTQLNNSYLSGDIKYTSEAPEVSKIVTYETINDNRTDFNVSYLSTQELNTSLDANNFQVTDVGHKQNINFKDQVTAVNSMTNIDSNSSITQNISVTSIPTAATTVKELSSTDIKLSLNSFNNRIATENVTVAVNTANTPKSKLKSSTNSTSSIQNNVSQNNASTIKSSKVNNETIVDATEPLVMSTIVKSIDNNVGSIPISEPEITITLNKNQSEMVIETSTEPLIQTEKDYSSTLATNLLSSTDVVADSRHRNTSKYATNVAKYIDSNTGELSMITEEQENLTVAAQQFYDANVTNTSSIEFSESTQNPIMSNPLTLFNPDMHATILPTTARNTDTSIDNVYKINNATPQATVTEDYVQTKSQNSKKIMFPSTNVADNEFTMSPITDTNVFKEGSTIIVDISSSAIAQSSAEISKDSLTTESLKHSKSTDMPSDLLLTDVSPNMNVTLIPMTENSITTIKENAPTISQKISQRSDVITAAKNVIRSSDFGTNPPVVNQNTHVLNIFTVFNLTNNSDVQVHIESNAQLKTDNVPTPLSIQTKSEIKPLVWAELDNRNVSNVNITTTQTRSTSNKSEQIIPNKNEKREIQPLVTTTISSDISQLTWSKISDNNSLITEPSKEHIALTEVGSIITIGPSYTEPSIQVYSDSSSNTIETSTTTPTSVKVGNELSLSANDVLRHTIINNIRPTLEEIPTTESQLNPATLEGNTKSSTTSVIRIIDGSNKGEDSMDALGIANTNEKVTEQQVLPKKSQIFSVTLPVGIQNFETSEFAIGTVTTEDQASTTNIIDNPKDLVSDLQIPRAESELSYVTLPFTIKQSYAASENVQGITTGETIKSTEKVDTKKTVSETQISVPKSQFSFNISPLDTQKSQVAYENVIDVPTEGQPNYLNKIDNLKNILRDPHNVTNSHLSLVNLPLNRQRLNITTSKVGGVTIEGQVGQQQKPSNINNAINVVPGLQVLKDELKLSSMILPLSNQQSYTTSRNAGGASTEVRQTNPNKIYTAKDVLSFSQMATTKAQLSSVDGPLNTQQSHSRAGELGSTSTESQPINSNKIDHEKNVVPESQISVPDLRRNLDVQMSTAESQLNSVNLLLSTRLSQTAPRNAEGASIEAKQTNLVKKKDVVSNPHMPTKEFQLNSITLPRNTQKPNIAFGRVEGSTETKLEKITKTANTVPEIQTSVTKSELSLITSPLATKQSYIVFENAVSNSIKAQVVTPESIYKTENAEAPNLFTDNMKTKIDHSSKVELTSHDLKTIPTINIDLSINESVNPKIMTTVALPDEGISPDIAAISDVTIDKTKKMHNTHSGIISLRHPKENTEHSTDFDNSSKQTTSNFEIKTKTINNNIKLNNTIQNNNSTREELLTKTDNDNLKSYGPNNDASSVNTDKNTHSKSNISFTVTPTAKLPGFITQTYNNHTSNITSKSQNDIMNAQNTTVSSNDQNTPLYSMSQTKPTVVKMTQTEFPAFESTTTKLNVNIFTCKHKLRGRYADQQDCRKFYICLGQSHVVAGVCPVNTVFSEIRKQCTKNLSHCIRNNQFRCAAAGRFSDFLNDNIYYICVKNNVSSFIRFKLQCQNGYHLNKTSVQCVLNNESTSTSDISKNNSDLSLSSAVTKPKKKSVTKFKCKKEGVFADPKDCRRYFVCKESDREGYRQKIKRCDSDEIFHNDRKKCVDAESYVCN